MRTKDKTEALRLRIDKKLSYGAISKRLKVPKSTLSEWLRDIPLPEKHLLKLRRAAWTRGEASRELFRRTMREKREQKERTIYQKQLLKFNKISPDSLFIAGLMLYLGEGEKKSRHRIVLTNTDLRIVQFFIFWLKKFFHITQSKMRIELHLYESMDIPLEERFWLKTLGFKRPQLYKTQVRSLQKSSFTYRESYRHGTCQLYAGGVEHKTKLMLSIKAFLDTYKHTRA